MTGSGVIPSAHAPSSVTCSALVRSISVATATSMLRAASAPRRSVRRFVAVPEPRDARDPRLAGRMGRPARARAQAEAGLRRRAAGFSPGLRTSSKTRRRRHRQSPMHMQSARLGCPRLADARSPKGASFRRAVKVLLSEIAWLSSALSAAGSRAPRLLKTVRRCGSGLGWLFGLPLRVSAGAELVPDRRFASWASQTWGGAAAAPSRWALDTSRSAPSVKSADASRWWSGGPSST